jgi:hypothetical protein
MVWLKRQEWDGGREIPRGGGCSIIASEVVSSAGDIPDAIGWQMGRSVMVECKASRADFLADARKPQRRAGTGVGEQRYFLTPKGLLSKEDIPAGWGLLEVDGKRAECVIRATRRELDLQGHVQEKLMLLSLVRRIRTREFLIVQPEQMEAILVA